MRVNGDDCRNRIYEQYGDAVEFSDRMLGRVTHRQILWRMLNNLKVIYEAERDYHRAHKVQELLLCIHPGGPAQIRDRGLIRYRLALLGEAAADLQEYVRAAPDAPDVSDIRNRLQELQRLAPRMN